jgi:hypothetical protein
MGMTQHELHQALKSEALANHRRVSELARPLDPERLVRRPTPPGWSVGEVLEHLCIADELYHKPLTALVTTARPDAGAPAREWRPSIFGKLIAGALARPGKMKAPGRFKPGASPRNGVVEDFLARDSRLIAMMDDAASLDWRALRMSSPALPVPIIRLNLGDVFKIHVVHVRRHLGQMERVVNGMKQ